MKKLIFSFAILSLVFVTSCGDDDKEERTCEIIQTELTEATEATFGIGATEEDCNSFVQLANEYIADGCGTEEERSELQDIINIIDCSAL